MPEREPHPWNDDTEEELFPIEKNVPIENFGHIKTDNEGGKELRRKSPFEHLSIGDSFVVPFINAGEFRIRNMCYYAGNKLGRAFSYRQDYQSGGYRIWRVATPEEKRLLKETGEAR